MLSSLAELCLGRAAVQGTDVPSLPLRKAGMSPSAMQLRGRVSPAHMREFNSTVWPFSLGIFSHRTGADLHLALSMAKVTESLLGSRVTLVFLIPAKNDARSIAAVTCLWK